MVMYEEEVRKRKSCDAARSCAFDRIWTSQGSLGAIKRMGSLGCQNPPPFLLSTLSFSSKTSLATVFPLVVVASHSLTVAHLHLNA